MAYRRLFGDRTTSFHAKSSFDRNISTRQTFSEPLLTVGSETFRSFSSERSIHEPDDGNEALINYDFKSCLITNDFAKRDLLPQTLVPKSQWSNYGMWGPPAAVYPVAVPCPHIANNPELTLTWQRDRIVAAARKYIGLPYAHHHIPAYDDKDVEVDGERINDSGHGLDCSNFTSWVYNFALGKKFTSDITKQSELVGRKLEPNESWKHGDLLFFWRQDRSEISHVGIYTGGGKIIDSRGRLGGVTEHNLEGWYDSHFAYARRVLE